MGFSTWRVTDGTTALVRDSCSLLPIPHFNKYLPLATLAHFSATLYPTITPTSNRKTDQKSEHNSPAGKCRRPLVHRLHCVCVCVCVCACACVHACSSTNLAICSCFPSRFGSEQREAHLGGPAPRAEFSWWFGACNLRRLTLHSFFRRHHCLQQEERVRGRGLKSYSYPFICSSLCPSYPGMGDVQTPA